MADAPPASTAGGGDAAPAPAPKQLTEQQLADGLRQLRTDFRTAAIAHVRPPRSLSRLLLFLTSRVPPRSSRSCSCTTLEELSTPTCVHRVGFICGSRGVET